MSTITRKAPSIIYRKVAIKSESYNEETNTIDVVFATDTPVHRFDWREWEDFDEILLIEDGAIILDRLESRAVPFLKDHTNSVDTTLGRVEKVWIDKKEAWASIKLSERKAHEDLIKDIKGGILRNISVGYTVHEYDRMPKAADNSRRKYVARKWELLEVSLVGVAADHKSSVRSTGGNEDHFITINDLDMSIQTPSVNDTPPVTQPTPPVAPPVDVEQIRAEERRRTTEINQYCRSFGISQQFADDLINSNKTIDQCRAAIMAEAIQKSPTQNITNANPPKTNEVDFRKVMVAGMLMRAGFTSVAESDKRFSEQILEEAHAVRNFSLLDVARESLMRSGVSLNEIRRMNPHEVAKRAITSSTSDFPIALQDLNNIILLSKYRIQKLVWNKFAAVGSNADFRPNKRMRGGSLGNIGRLQENGEYKTKAIPDADFEQTTVDTWGEMINISRKMIVDDSFGFFTSLAADMGTAMARTIEVEVFRNLFLNSGNGPVLTSDSKTIFHADHKNITTAGGLTVEKLNEAYVLMRKQMEKNQQDYIEVTPEILLIDVARRGDALIYNSAEFNPDTNNNRNIPNKVRGLFSQIVDSPRMDDSAYYLFANPGEFPVLEVTYLNGQTEPMMESEFGFNVDGVRLKIRHDFDVNAVGFRGAVKVPKV